MDINTADIPLHTWQLISIPPPPLLHYITKVLTSLWGVIWVWAIPELRALTQDSTPTTYYHIRQIRITLLVLNICKCELVKWNLSWVALKFLWLHLKTLNSTLNLTDSVNKNKYEMKKIK